MIRSLYILIISTLFTLSVALGQSESRLEKKNGQWELLFNDQPFDIKGVTFGYDKEVEKYDEHMKHLKSIGVNTIRLWGTNDDTKKLLDAAYANDINIMVGIWMRHGRPGMEGDDSFNYLKDAQGMEDMYNYAMKTVEDYKKHPAVLTWGVGNEVFLNIGSDAEKLAYSKFLEKVCSDIKKKDPKHIITSVEAWTFGLDWWPKYCPSIDLYGINSYGGGAASLPEQFKEKGIDKPYVITEFGVYGEWDQKEDKNGIKLDPTDEEKYNAIAQGYHEWIKGKPSCLGVYVFHYGDGKDFGATWLLMKYNGLLRPAYWATREAFTGKKPTDYVPKITEFSLPDTTLPSGKWVKTKLVFSDVEDEELKNVSFYYNQRTGSRKRKSQISLLYSRIDGEGNYLIQLPDVDGAIKVYAMIKDSGGNVGIATSSFMIKNKTPLNKFPVPKAELPFYVYKDDGELPYFPSAYMGNQKFLGLDLKNERAVHSGKTSIQLSYGDSGNWYGLGFVDPPDDWGDQLGGYNVNGATKYSFWAKGSSENIEASIGFGLIGKDKKYHDTETMSMKIKLTTEWKRYSIDLRGADLSCIRSGLVIYSSGTGSPHFIWIDDVVFE